MSNSGPGVQAIGEPLAVNQEYTISLALFAGGAVAHAVSLRPVLVTSWLTLIETNHEVLKHLETCAACAQSLKTGRG
jgi:hypothetical protein